MNSIAVTVVAVVALERLAELWQARRNTRALLDAGGVEVGRGHYPLIVAFLNETEQSPCRHGLRNESC